MTIIGRLTPARVASLCAVLVLWVALALPARADGDAKPVELMPPAPGETLVIEAADYALLWFSSGFGPSEPVLRLEGDDLLILFPGATQAEDSTIRLRGFAALAPPPDIETPDGFIEGAQVLGVLTAAGPGAMDSLEDVKGALEPAAAGPGGPVASVPVIGWFASRLKGMFAASAAEPTLAPTAGGAQGAQLEQLLAGLGVIRASAFDRAAIALRDELQALLPAIEDMVAAGRGSLADQTLMRSAEILGRLETLEARVGLAEALDGYEELAGLRPTPDAFSAPADRAEALLQDRDSFLAALPEPARADGKTVWRRLDLAQESLPLRRTRLEQVTDLQSMYRDQFNLGRRTLGELLSIVRALFDARVDLAQNEFDLQAYRARALAMAERLQEEDRTVAP